MDAVVPIWDERRSLSGNTTAVVVAFLVPSSGVGWVDFQLLRSSLLVRSARIVNTERMVANWAGKTHAEAVRDVIAAADAWFIHCAEQAERAEALRALAGGPRIGGETLPSDKSDPGTDVLLYSMLIRLTPKPSVAIFKG